VNKENLKQGGLRLLTRGEIALATAVFKNTIQYHTVWIHHDSYLPFNLQNKYVAMTPNGEMYFREWYRDDFSQSTDELEHMFIHEMSHSVIKTYLSQNGNFYIASALSFRWSMKIKIFFLVIISRALRGTGMGFGVSGMVFSIWFFLFSDAEYKYLWSLFSIIIFCIGYLIYRLAYSYIYDEWDKYH